MGVNVPRPKIGTIDFGDDRSFVMLAFVALVLCIGIVMLVQRGTIGRYLAAMRGSPTAAASLGISLTEPRLTVFAMSAGIAGLGGALYGSAQQSAAASGFVYEISLAFVVVVITTGSQSVEGAVQAGMAYAVFATILNVRPPALLRHRAHPVRLRGPDVRRASRRHRRVPEDQVDEPGGPVSCAPTTSAGRARPGRRARP